MSLAHRKYRTKQIFHSILLFAELFIRRNERRRKYFILFVPAQRERERERKFPFLPLKFFSLVLRGQRKFNQVLFINYLPMLRAAGGTFFKLNKALIRNLKSRK